MDLSRFHATFHAESREGLDAMESGLLSIEAGAGDAETIHTVFRAAHSIKGGAGTFGFEAIAQLTHLAETLLELIRKGQRPTDPASTAALLSAVDALRALFDAAEHGHEADASVAAGASARLRSLIESTPDAAPPAEPARSPRHDALPRMWTIHFRPGPSLYLRGNDPLRIFRELAALGPLDAHCALDSLPDFESLVVDRCHLGWRLHLPATVAARDIAEAFAWVDGDDHLDILAPGDGTARPADAGQGSESSAATNDGAAGVSSASPAAAGPGPQGAGGNAEATLRVRTGKVDTLVNLVGELVITRSMLQQCAAGLEPARHAALLDGLALLERNTRELQDAVIGIRMLPVASVFNRFPRMVRDLAEQLGKQVRLVTRGEATELDKGMIEKVADPLVHLVRNAIDHGLEAPEVRRANGKPDHGTISLSASQRGGHIVISVADDGRGLDRARILDKAAQNSIPVPADPTDADVWALIFEPGFSTAATVTELSGRGVGMDVVRNNIVELGGDVRIDSRPGAGTCFEVSMPLTMAIVDGMIVRAAAETFVLPLGVVSEALQPGSAAVRRVHGEGRLLELRGDFLPLFDLCALYGTARRGDAAPVIVVVEGDGDRLALEVDALLGQQQVVVKNLEAHYRRVAGISGATILGDGQVALIVDTAGLAREIRGHGPVSSSGRCATASAQGSARAAATH